MFDFLVGILLGVCIGQAWMTWSMMVSARKLEQTIRDLSDSVPETSHTVYCMIEQHGEQYYLFDQETNQFLTQGRTVEELLSKVPKDLNIRIVGGDQDVIQRFTKNVLVPRD